MSANEIENHILIDAHVHIYDCFDLETLLDAAVENFQAQYVKLGLQPGSYLGALLLTESGKYDVFNNISAEKGIAEDTVKNWVFTSFSEDANIISAVRENNGLVRILICAGRQIVTREGIELLALITNSHFEDGIPIKDSIAQVRQAGGLPVLPWGVGKWLSKRGELVSALLQSEQQSEGSSDLFLGDNSGRPKFWWSLNHFKQAKAAGIKILPGSDPLPLKGEHARVGKFGFGIKWNFSGDSPGEALKDALIKKDNNINPYGNLEGFVTFFRNQLTLRL